MRDLFVARLEADIELVPGGGGVFDIKHKGDLLYSKKTTGRFPNDTEISDLVKLLGG